MKRNRSHSVTTVPIRRSSDGYFEIDETVQPMTLANLIPENELCNITQGKNDTTFYDAFLAVTHISYEGFRFSRNRIITHNDGTKTYSFKYLHCLKRVNIFSDPKNTKYDILDTDKTKNMTHQAFCAKFSENDLKIQEGIQRMKAYAVQLKQNNMNYGPCLLLARVLMEQNRYNNDHPNCMIPIFKRSTIESWFNEAFAVKSSDMKRNNIPPALSQLGGGWVKFQCFIDKKSYIILSFTEMSNYASVTRRLLLDGTYKSRPTDYAQVLNGVGYLNNADRYCPIFHILMEDQKAETYLFTLKMVFMIFNFTNLKTIHTDFEAAELLALKSLFRKNEEGKRKYRLQGCLFHFVQRIEQNLHELEDPLLDKYKRAFLNTPYLTENDFNEFMSYMENISKIKEFYSYFNRQWGLKGKLSREIWSIPADDPFMNLTNDGVERYNKEANVELDHPNLMVFIQKTADIDTRILMNIRHKSITQNNTGRAYEKKTTYEARSEIHQLFPALFGKSSYKLNKNARKIVQNEVHDTEELLDVEMQFDISNSFIPKKMPLKKLTTKRPGQKRKGEARRRQEKAYSKKLQESIDKIDGIQRKRYTGSYQDRENSEEEEIIDENPKISKKNNRRHSCA